MVRSLMARIRRAVRAMTWQESAEHREAKRRAQEQRDRLERLARRRALAMRVDTVRHPRD